MPTSTSSATWEGGLRGGRGHFQAGSGAFSGDYSFATRFESAKGTNPEELIAAAHASCLSMALSAGLEAAKTPADPRSAPRPPARSRRWVTASGSRRCGWKCGARCPASIRPASAAAAEKAKDGCPVSQALKGNVPFELDARLA